jgi:phospholipid/cholesterol/gamma-HCH transport system substrate-binding protein
MLSERTRNMAVGATMIVALGVLMYGILLLGKGPTLGGRPYAVTLESPNANGLTPGAKVDLNGVVIGEVSSVILAKKADGTLGTRVGLSIDGSVDIPQDSTVSFGKGYVGSSSYCSIYANNAKGPNLPKDGSALLQAAPADGGLIPKDVFDDIHALKNDLSGLSVELTGVAKDMHALLETSSPEAVDAANPKDPHRPIENISTMVMRLDRTVKNLQDLLGDKKLQGQVREIVQNIASSSEQLKSTLTTIDTTMKNADRTVAQFGSAATQASTTLNDTQHQIVRIADKLVDTLDQLQKTTRAVSEGDGTTGRLIRDPRLYDGMVDLSKSLRGTVDDLDFLLKKWRDEGVNLKF